MKPARSLVSLAMSIAAALPLAACSQSQGRQIEPGTDGGAGYPARLALGSVTLPSDTAPLQPEGAAWQADTPDRIAFGLPGQQPLLAIACTRDGAGVAAIRILRATRAEEGAKALFALVGNGRIARLSLDARQPGEAGQWEGVIPADDPRLDVLRGSNSIEATLPGGGTLKLPASGAPGRLLAECRAGNSAAQIS